MLKKNKKWERDYILYLRTKDKPNPNLVGTYHMQEYHFMQLKDKIRLNKFTKTNHMLPKEATKRPKPLHIIDKFFSLTFYKHLRLCSIYKLSLFKNHFHPTFFKPQWARGPLTSHNKYTWGVKLWADRAYSPFLWLWSNFQC